MKLPGENELRDVSLQIRGNMHQYMIGVIASRVSGTAWRLVNDNRSNGLDGTPSGIVLLVRESLR